ncbi:MAG: hypothetical protein AAFV71_19550 [Cyanobacteria bacterium J06633_8]
MNKIIKINRDYHRIIELNQDYISAIYTVGILHFEKNIFGNNRINSISKKRKDFCKPYGSLLTAIFRLCERCHTFQDFYQPVPFSNALKWFNECLFELIEIDYLESLNNNPTNHPKSDNHWKDKLQKLKDTDAVFSDIPTQIISHNPFSEYNAPALTLLIEQGLFMAGNNTKFKKEYWNPLVDAIREIISLSKKKNTITLSIETDSATISASRHGGRRKKAKIPANIKSIEKLFFNSSK